VGLVSAVDAATGRVRWQYQATPQLYVLSRVAMSQGVAYVSGMDGSVTALAGPR
jgi:outer membrane protein assembly factor BamB